MNAENSAPLRMIAESAANAAAYTILLDTDEAYDAPAAPGIHAAHPLLAPEFLGRTLTHRPKDVVAAPTTWEGRVRGRRPDAAVAITEGAAIDITWAPAKPLTVTVHE